MVSKEYWSDLSDEEKSKVIQEFCKIHGLGENFDYAKARDFHEQIKERYKECGHTPNKAFEHPVLVLKLVDPILADMVFSWMYTKVEFPNGKESTVPFMGYHLLEYVFDKNTLMEFTDEEKDILNHAMYILKSKGV